MQMTISRRTFCAGVIAGSGSRAMPAAVEGHLPPQTAVAATGSHIGNLYPFVQAQADKSPLELSFLRPEFKDLRRWQTRARSRIFDHLFYAPPRVAPQAQVVRRRDMGEYVEETSLSRPRPTSGSRHMCSCPRKPTVRRQASSRYTVTTVCTCGERKR